MEKLTMEKGKIFFFPLGKTLSMKLNEFTTADYLRPNNMLE